MKRLVFPEGYTIDGYEIIGKRGVPLKPDRRDVFTLQARGCPPVRANRYKLVWCARNGVDVRDIPKEFSFRLSDNGVLIVETFSDRMSSVRKRLANTVKVQFEDYDFIERFASTAKRMISGEPEALADLFVLLNSQRDSLIQYARTASGGVSLQKAIYYTDKAIIKVYDMLCARTNAVASPIASIKWHINHFIKIGRKK